MEKDRILSNGAKQQGHSYYLRDSLKSEETMFLTSNTRTWLIDGFGNTTCLDVIVSRASCMIGFEI